MEEYLKKDYGVIESKKWLSSVEEIEDFFKDYALECLDCGQGYYQDEADFICKIGDRYYKVHVSAEIESSKQDRGDRLYWVEKISDITWEEIDKPEPKEVLFFSYEFAVNPDEKKKLDYFLNENDFNYKQK